MRENCFENTEGHFYVGVSNVFLDMNFFTFVKFAVAAMHVGAAFANPTSLEARQGACTAVCGMDSDCPPACPNEPACLSVPDVLGLPVPVTLPGVCVTPEIKALSACVLSVTKTCFDDTGCPGTCSAIPGVSVSYFCYKPIPLLGVLGLGVCIPKTP
ncbi:hypothetical protein C8Q78DRAFT_390070 [Trametes maxima]|nr:hypothetical protein C8Q78DRAFT_390070 [Trametes maxima]